MANITTLDGMKNYVKGQLGSPVINIEMTDGQLEQCIEDAAQIINRYLYGEAIYEDYLSFTATSGVDEYSLSGNDISEVFDFDFSTGTNGINSLFSPLNTLLYDDWVVKGNYPGSGNTQLTHYLIQMNNLEDIMRLFERSFRVDWRPSKQVLKLTPTPTQTLVGLLKVYKKSQATEIYNHPFMKRLSIAKAKQLWGFILGKYQINLPGGGTTNGSEIKQDGLDSEEKVMSDIRDESEPPIFFIA